MDSIVPTDLISEVSENSCPNPEKNLFQDIWNEYERVIVHSLITTFGLDFLVHDQIGGDVDTVHNVKETGEFKNPMYERNYEHRGAYDSSVYHRHETYRDIVSRQRRSFNNSGIPLNDSYSPGNTLVFSTARGVGPWRRAALDHVVSAHEIHDDPVRVLSGISGVDLANDPENLRFTSISLNSKMSDKPIDEFINWCEQNPSRVNWNGVPGAGLPEDVKKRLKEEDKRAREHYISTIEKEYYSSPQFYKNVASAACKRGLEMGLRQVLGCVLLELWIGCKNELASVPEGCDYKKCIGAIGTGIKKGFAQALNNYESLLRNFSDGFEAGMLASFITTLVNIFVTTDVNQAKYIRYGCTSIVQAGKVLLINPEDLLLGDQIKQSTVILANGASMIAGSMVGDELAKTPLARIKGVGDCLVRFVSVLVSGLLSCTLLLLLDRSDYINYIVAEMNKYTTIDHNIKELSNQMTRIAAYYADTDVPTFVAGCNQFESITNTICCSESDSYYDAIKEYITSGFISLPFAGDLDSFLSDANNHLDFS